MKMKQRAGAAALLLAVLGLSACGNARANEGEGGLQLATAETRDLMIRVDASGEIEPLRMVEVKSLAGGEILRLHVDNGDDLEQGTLIAEIDPRDVRNTFAQATADVEVATASLATREAALRRATELREAGIMTVQEFEVADLDATSARAQLVRARTNLELASERMRDITIRAPITGTVVQKQVEAGQIVSSATSNVGGGTTLVMMADLSVMQVRTLVDQTDIGKLAVGQPARVTVDAYPGRVFEGVVTKIEPQAQIEQNVTMFPVLVRLDNADRLLLPGMNADVEVNVSERRDVVTVPNGAIVNPRTAMQTAEALGIDAEALRAGMRGERSGRPGGPDGAAPGPANGSDSPRAEGATRSGMRGQGGMGMRPGAGSMAGSGDGPRTGVVFVMGEGGPEARGITLGVNDLDFTEIVRGLEAGEQVILTTLLQVQQQQEQMQNRMRQRSGGLPGTGGGR